MVRMISLTVVRAFSKLVMSVLAIFFIALGVLYLAFGVLITGIEMIRSGARAFPDKITRIVLFSRSVA